MKIKSLALGVVLSMVACGQAGTQESSGSTAGGGTSGAAGSTTAKVCDSHTDCSFVIGNDICTSSWCDPTGATAPGSTIIGCNTRPAPEGTACVIDDYAGVPRTGTCHGQQPHVCVIGGCTLHGCTDPMSGGAVPDGTVCHLDGGAATCLGGCCTPVP